MRGTSLGATAHVATQKYSSEGPITLLLGALQGALEKVAPDVTLASPLLSRFLPVCRLEAPWGREHPRGRGKESRCPDSSFHGEKQAGLCNGRFLTAGRGVPLQVSYKATDTHQVLPVIAPETGQRLWVGSGRCWVDLKQRGTQCASRLMAQAFFPRAHFSARHPHVHPRVNPRCS